jgi:hypothetical protein
VSIGSIIKSVSAGFADAFWRGFEEARAQSGATAHDRELDANHPFFQSEAFKTVLAEVIQSAYDAGKQAERKRIAEVLQAPGVASYPLLAFELAIDGAGVAQVSAVIARTEVAVQARLHPTEPLESTSSVPTLH